MKIIKIDGSYLSGGGQIVRTALALSIITKKAFKIENIRAGKPTPGLKAQHLTAINTLKELFDIDVKGNNLQSTELEFILKNNDLLKTSLEIDIGTAGSITLLLQSLVPALLFSNKPCSLEITGGTDVKWSPSVDYMVNVLFPHLHRFGEIKFELINRGYFPKGNGKAKIKIAPSKIKEIIPFDLVKRFNLLQIRGISHASTLLEKSKVAERQASAAKNVLEGLGLVDISTEYRDTLSIGTGITLIARFGLDEVNIRNPVLLGSCNLGEKKVSAEQVGQDAAHQLLKEINSNACVDSHLADQLIPFLALTGGAIKTSEITQHTLANIYVTELFLDKTFEIDKENNIIKI